MPAIKATQRRVQSSLSNLGSGGSTLRFGRVWTTAMVAQVTLTAIAIPVAGESLHQMLRKQTMRADFASSEYVTAQADIDQTFADTGTRTFEERRGRVLAALQQRIAQEPGVVAMTFADQAPGAEPHTRVVDVETSLGGGPAFDDLVWTAAIGPGFFETFASRVIAGRDFDGRDRTGAANSVIVNEAFARRFTQASSISSPLGSRVRYEAPRGAPASPWREIVGIARDIGLDPEDRGPCCSEAPYVYQPATANTVTPFAMTIHVRGDAAGMVARLPNIAAAADSALRVEQAQTLRERLERRNRANLAPLWTLAAVTGLALFLSGLGLFSLTSVSVSRRTREIGLRAALGAGPREILASIFVRVGGLVGSGIVIGGLLLGLFGLTAGDDVSRAMFVAWLAITSTVMVIAGFLACVGPARRALRINPTEALRET